MNYLTATKNKKYLMYISQNYSYAILRPLQAEILAQGGEVKWFL
ncbi:MAG: CDP-glycerol--glycerophosphate glycerophosphotransferase, partial [Pseudoalteromonas tetraodonis]